MKKIVAIGGGENGRVDETGKVYPYDTKSIDKEIVNLTGKKNPNFLFINHAMNFSLEIQDSYYHTMKKIYGDIFGCHCRDLKSNELENIDIVKEKVKWADIIYEGGGDTLSMINLWKETGFDEILYEAWNDGKVISGISAGAVCYFKSCNSDSVDEQFETVDCLDWYNLFITPHCNEIGRYESTKKQLKENNLIGIMLSNKSALEIVDDKYRILFSDNKDGVIPYVIKGYWDNGIYKERKLDNQEFKDIKDLFSRDVE